MVLSDKAEKLYDFLFERTAALFKQTEPPPLLFVLNDEDQLVIQEMPSPDKDAWAYLHQEAAASPHCQCAVLVNEVWVLELAGLSAEERRRAQAQATKQGISTHPLRKSAVTFNVLTQTGQALAVCPLETGTGMLTKGELIWLSKDSDLKVTGRFVREG